MANNQIVIDLEANVSQLKIERFNDALVKTEKSVVNVKKELEKSKSGFFDDITQSILKADVVTTAFTSTLSFIKSSFTNAIDAYSEAENSLNTLKGSLIATNEATSQNIKDFQDFASQIQSITKFDDDLIISQIALAKNFGLTNTQAKNLVKAATELATILNIDLGSAVETLLKSLEGQGRGLKLLGKDFSELTKEELEAGKAIDLINQKFSGQALNATKTYSGQVAQLSNNISDLLEIIGEFITGATKQTGVYSLLNSAIETTVGFLGSLTSGLFDTDKALENANKNYKDSVAKFGEFSNQAKLAKYELDRLNRSLGDSKKVDVDTSKFEAIATITKEQKEEQEKLLKELNEKYKYYGLDEIDILKQKANEEIKIANGSKETILKIREKLADDIFLIQDKALDLEFKRFEENEKKKKELAEKERKELSKNITEAGSNLLSGAEGAKKQLASVGGKVLEKVTGIEGLGPILEKLFAGPEAVRGLVSSFAQAIPSLIENLILAIPVLIDQLLIELPRLIDSLVAKAPEIIFELIRSLPMIVNSLVAMLPDVAMGFMFALIEEAPTLITALAYGIYDAIVGIFDQLNPFNDNGATGGIVSGIGDFLGFADGGMVKKVPSGFNNDTFPARLSSGELVVNRDTSNKLEDFLNKGDEVTNILLGKILSTLSKENTQQIVVKVGDRELASIIDDQIRRGLITRLAR